MTESRHKSLNGVEAEAKACERSLSGVEAHPRKGIGNGRGWSGSCESMVFRNMGSDSNEPDSGVPAGNVRANPGGGF